MTQRSPLEKVAPRHYPRAFAKSVKNVGSLRRSVPVHPAHFVVGMDDEKWPLYPEGLAGNKVEGTAIQCASYVARVEQVTEKGEVSVTLWERPNGREGITTLLVNGPLEEKWPSVGDLLWIWTWIDVVNGQAKTKIHVEIEHAELSEADRTDLKKLLAELKPDEP